MNIRIILWTGLLLQACSIKQQRKSENSQVSLLGLLQVHADSLDRQDTLTELFGRQFYLGNELLDITPIGPFTYHPDSGFAGQAARIQLYREQICLADSGQRRQGISERKISQQQLVAQHAVAAVSSEVRASQRSVFRWGWLGLLGLVPLFWLAICWFRGRR